MKNTELNKVYTHYLSSKIGHLRSGDNLHSSEFSFRPSFTSEEVKKIAMEIYGIEGSITELPSYDDQNFLIQSENAFIVKIANKSEDKLRLELQNEALLFLQTTNNKDSFPHPIQSISNEYISRIPGKDNSGNLIRLLTYIPGKVIANVNPNTSQLIHDIGMFLGKLDNSLSDFSHPEMKRDVTWDLKHSPSTIRKHMNYITDDKKLQLINHYLAEFEKLDLSNFRESVIHNDANEYNLIQLENSIGLIDFGDIVYTYSIFELAIAAAYLILRKKDPLDTITTLITGYNSVNQLTESEIDAIYTLICIRLSISVSVSAYQYKMDPTNEYLLASAIPAWEMLYRLREIHPRFAAFAFRRACGLNIDAMVDVIKNFLSTTTISPIFSFNMDDSNSIIFDLSIQSRDLGLQTDFGDSKTTGRLIDQKKRENKAKVAIGRYDEIRLQYLVDQFKVEMDDGLFWKNTHLGIDLFVDEGTEIFVPIKGIVHSYANNAGRFDWGPTIILEHRINDDYRFYTLYGHLSIDSLDNLKVGQKFAAGDLLGTVGSYEINGNWPPHLHFQIISDLLDKVGDYIGVVSVHQKEIWKTICPDPNMILKIKWLDLEMNEISIEHTLKQREERIGKALSIAYIKPLKIVRGQMQYLIDHNGRIYLDVVNNVPHVGHTHPQVVKAIQEQLELITTNTRYLHDNITKYAEQLCSTMPEGLEVCFFVNSGSEANELALRLARTYTGGDEIIVLDCAYHGNTNYLTDISPYKFDGPGGNKGSPHAHKVSTPDIYRGSHRGPDAGERYAEEIENCIKDLEGKDVAAFICETFPGVGGQIVLPDNYLKHAFNYVRDAGGVCIADEVQVGLGRLGSYFWGFEQQGVVPDIVVLGKPIGNGHPLGAVVTTRKIADAFDNGMEYFNTTGGNPVSCAAGLAVLDVLEEEKLQAHALEVGTFLKGLLVELSGKYDIIGDVRGMGLFLGVELVLDEDLTPAAEEAAYVVERLRDHGILMSTDGPLHNVLKIKPPMAFNKKNAIFFVDTLEKILKEDFLDLNINSSNHQKI